MSLLLSMVLGLIFGFLGFTLFGSLAFYALAACYVFALYLLFFRNSRLAFGYLAGLTLANELLGTVHLGRAGFFLLTILLIYHFFKERLRFTSLFLRYIVALLLLLPLYDFWLFPLTGFTHRLVLLGWSALPFIFLSYSAYSFRQQHPHEFV